MNFPAGSRLTKCPVCGSSDLDFEVILWPELIKAWELSESEADYINLQQGLHCVRCRNNLRSMTLAAAIMTAFDFEGSFEDFCQSNPLMRQLKVVEINEAGKLSPFLKLLPGHAQYFFPEIDMQRLSFKDESIDLLVHSDTLEHVPDSRAGLRECRRVLKQGGYLFYTVPVIVGRLTRRRHGLPPSYHGNSKKAADDYVVQTEYGADFWCELFEAGFNQISVTTLIYPASMAISAIKT